MNEKRRRRSKQKNKVREEDEQKQQKIPSYLHFCTDLQPVRLMAQNFVMII